MQRKLTNVVVAGLGGQGVLKASDILADVAVRAGVKHLIMFHYDQDYGDELVDELAQRCRRALDERGASACKLTAAHEGLTLTV